MVVIEVRIGMEGDTLRMRKAGNGHFILEIWNRPHATWSTLQQHEEFYIVMHAFFDEVCRRAERTRREMERKALPEK